MITVTQIDVRNMQDGLVGLANLGIPMRLILEKELGEAVKTLVRISWPKDRQKAAATLTDTVKRRFELLNTDVRPAWRTGNISHTGIEWLSVNRDWLMGVALPEDKRKASVQELRKLYYTTTKGGKLKKQFQQPRKHQQVLLLQKIVTTAAKGAAVARRIVQNYGRLKAGWLAGVRDGAIKITGANKPPAWVMRHVNAGTRGRFENRLGERNNPNGTIVNSAKGVTAEKNLWLIQQAIKIRSQAILKNVQFYLRGKKNVADYGKDKIPRWRNYSTN